MPRLRRGLLLGSQLCSSPHSTPCCAPSACTSFLYEGLERCRLSENSPCPASPFLAVTALLPPFCPESPGAPVCHSLSPFTLFYPVSYVCTLGTPLCSGFRLKPREYEAQDGICTGLITKTAEDARQLYKERHSHSHRDTEKEGISLGERGSK